MIAAAAGTSCLRSTPLAVRVLLPPPAQPANDAARRSTADFAASAARPGVPDDGRPSGRFTQAHYPATGRLRRDDRGQPGGPFETTILGMTVTVRKITQAESGIVADCVRDGHHQAISVLDLPPPKGAQWIAAYRHWAGGL